MRYLISRFLPRSFNEWYAHAFGYFWLPCPLCGVNFGGHEWQGYKYGEIYQGGDSWKGICRNCAASNRERWEREQSQYYQRRIEALPAFRNTKEAMLYAQRNSIPVVVSAMDEPK